jgi:hypothetical protein
VGRKIILNKKIVDKASSSFTDFKSLLNETHLFLFIRRNTLVNVYGSPTTNNLKEINQVENSSE